MADNVLERMQATSHIAGGSGEYLDNLYECYLQDPQSVGSEWRDYFSQLPPVAHGNGRDVSHAEIRENFRTFANTRQPIMFQGVPLHEKMQAHVLQLINAYRTLGHHHAKLDPLGMTERVHVPSLDLAFHQLSEADYETVFSTETALTKNGATLAVIEEALQRSYCGPIGYEYMHITNTEETQWFQQRIESTQSRLSLSEQEQRAILQSLTAAEGLERYLGSKYVGQKRFSLEGADNLIPLLATMIERAGGYDVAEIIMGMAHRGRLNVLVNILGKSPEMLFGEFEGRNASHLSGDVKYHMGFSSNIQYEKGLMHLALAFNPSHLEIIAPVVEGSVRARLRRRGDLALKNKVIPLNIHGDAAFSGQGVVMETLNFSQSRGYSTGGTLHIVINNQIGFTTSNPLDARSTLYCTDVAKMVQAPVIHVNGNDPEAVLFAGQLALDYRMKFHKDVVIDLVCYRRHGHNEADEPSVTQPLMYEAIRQMPTPRELYAEKLATLNVISADEADAMVFNYRDALDKGESVTKTVSGDLTDQYAVDWTPYLDTSWRHDVNTGVPLTEIRRLANILETLPESFTPHPVVKRLLEERSKITAGETEMNWGYAETMAYATLIAEGYPVRLSGQDAGRGTFAHRHAVLHDYKTGELYLPLQSISSRRDQVIVIDSILSEEAVLGFEYGFAAADPNVLVLWEAQFGDFANGAQVVIDQFISSGEQKWGRLCGLVMLLPHGYEGQGPEHSSARLERYLQLCAQNNMQVCVPTTPAQVYHMLRRQMKRPFRKPLIVMTPKSLLRHKLATSPLQDLETGQFHLVIPEIDVLPNAKVKQVVVCCGKVYYDLLQQRREDKQNDVAIVRVEQLYPFPQEELMAELNKYPKAKRVIWCQEEPRNQGAWYPIRHHLEMCLTNGQTLTYVGRDFFAAPAVGHLSLHVKQQRELVANALTLEK